jgi:Reverse transcriptase (RNA-dependent DNA polymerase)
MGNNDEMIEEFKGTMTREFEMTDLGLMKFFLSLEVRQVETGIFVSHETYAKEILKKYMMTNCNPVSTPMEPGAKLSKFDGGERVDASRYRSLVGSLRYLTCTRPDLSLSVDIIIRFMEEPIYLHWKALKMNHTVHPRNGITRVVLLESRRLQVGWLLRQRLVRRHRRSEKYIEICVLYGRYCVYLAFKEATDRDTLDV